MFIYIPQGKSGRLTKNTPASKYFGVSGLFTDNFSSCSYIVGISEKKVCLMHIDAQSCTNEADTQRIQQELERVIEESQQKIEEANALPDSGKTSP